MLSLVVRTSIPTRSHQLYQTSAVTLWLLCLVLLVKTIFILLRHVSFYFCSSLSVWALHSALRKTSLVRPFNSSIHHVYKLYFYEGKEEKNHRSVASRILTVWTPLLPTLPMLPVCARALGICSISACYEHRPSHSRSCCAALFGGFNRGRFILFLCLQASNVCVAWRRSGLERGPLSLENNSACNKMCTSLSLLCNSAWKTNSRESNFVQVLPVRLEIREFEPLVSILCVNLLILQHHWVSTIFLEGKNGHVKPAQSSFGVIRELWSKVCKTSVYCLQWAEYVKLLGIMSFIIRLWNCKLE